MIFLEYELSIQRCFISLSLDGTVAYKTYQKAFVAHKARKDILRAPIDKINVTLITGSGGGNKYRLVNKITRYLYKAV